MKLSLRVVIRSLLPITWLITLLAESPAGVEKRDSVRVRHDDLLPFEKNADTPLIRSYPRLGMAAGAGISYTNYDALNQALHSVENSFRQQGYPVGPRSVDFGADGLWWVGLNLRLNEQFAIELDAGMKFKKEKSSANVLIEGYSVISTSVLYHIQARRDKPVHAFVGVGVSHTKFQITIPYGLSNQVSPVEPAGGYYYLSNVTGTAAYVSLPITVGIEFKVSGDGVLDLFGSYFHPFGTTMEISGASPTTVSFPAYLIGCRLAFNI